MTARVASGRPRAVFDLRRKACEAHGEYDDGCERCISRTTVYWLAVHNRRSRWRQASERYQQKREPTGKYVGQIEGEN